MFSVCRNSLVEPSASGDSMPTTQTTVALRLGAGGADVAADAEEHVGGRISRGHLHRVALGDAADVDAGLGVGYLHGAVGLVDDDGAEVRVRVGRLKLFFRGDVGRGGVVYRRLARVVPYAQHGAQGDVRLAAGAPRTSPARTRAGR